MLLRAASRVVAGRRPVTAASAVVLLSAATTKTTTARCAVRRPPPVFGDPGGARRRSTTTTTTTTTTVVDLPTTTTTTPGANKETIARGDEDCPVCAKYGRGPCGEAFRAWLACVDRSEAREDDGSVPECLDLARPLTECLERHRAHYDAVRVDDLRVDDDEDRGRREAWTDVVREVEAGRSSSSLARFPPGIALEAEVRPDARTGAVSFAPRFRGRDLLLAYVADDRTGELLGAGSHRDFFLDGATTTTTTTTRPTVRFRLTDDTETVRARAVYGDEDDAPLYHATMRVPPPQKKKKK